MLRNRFWVLGVVGLFFALFFPSYLRAAEEGNMVLSIKEIDQKETAVKEVRLVSKDFETGKNYQIETSFAIETNNLTYRIYFGYQDWNLFYVVEASTHNPGVRIGFCPGEPWGVVREDNWLKTLAPEDIRAIIPDFAFYTRKTQVIFHTLRVEVKEEKMTCFLDGKKLFEVEDDSLDKDGRIGFNVQGRGMGYAEKRLYIDSFKCTSAAEGGEEELFSDDFSVLPSPERYEIEKQRGKAVGSFEKLGLFPFGSSWTKPETAEAAAEE